MKVKDDERRGDQECRDALKALEEAKKETVEVVKKTEAFHRLWVDAKRNEDRARARQEQLRLREEGECKALRRKCALARELKAKMEDQESRLALREKEERQKSKRKEEEGGLEAVRRELQEDLYLEKTRKSLVWFSMGSHLMASDPLNARNTAELELVDSETFHMDRGVITARTTTRMMNEVVIEEDDTYNPGQIRKMTDKVKKCSRRRAQGTGRSK